MRMQKLKELPKFIRPFEFMGVHLDLDDEQANGTCPFCDKEQHFYVNPADGLNDCKSCGYSGNILGFYREVYNESLLRRPLTEADEFKGLSLATLNRFKVARSFLTDEWMIPYFSLKTEELLTFGIQIPEFGTELKYPPLLDHVLFNAHTLSKNADKPVVLCEGPSDAMALDASLRRHGSRNSYDVLAAPAANTFKEQWLHLFKGRELWLAFDNDDAGRAGQERIVDMFRASPYHPKYIAYMEWPRGVREKFDVRDLVQQGIPDLNKALDHTEPIQLAEEIEELLDTDEIEELDDDAIEELDDDAIEELAVE